MSDRPVYEIPLEPNMPGSGAQSVPPGFTPTPPSAYGPPPGAAAPPPVPPTLANAAPPSVPTAPAPSAPYASAEPPTFPAEPRPDPTAGSVPFPSAGDPFGFGAGPDAGSVPFPSGDAPFGEASGPMPSIDDLLAAAAERDAAANRGAAPQQAPAAPIPGGFESLIAETPSSAPSWAAATPPEALSPSSPAPPAAEPFTPAPAMSDPVPTPVAEPAPITLPDPDAAVRPIPVAVIDEAVLGTVPEELRSMDPDLVAALRSVGPTRASDLHITAGSPPTLRVDGSLRALDVPIWDADKTASALLGALTPARLEQFERERELDWALTISETERFRVNYSVQRGSIAAAFRIIPTKIKTLRELGMPDDVARFAALPRGLVLVTGPTGSGKSTTLAALVDLVNQTRADHIVTVEDPIEYLHTSKKSLVKQREVGQDTESFAKALKHVLRQDPDVILIGELRDLETISVALTAAETGHLVFATLHTQSAAQTIDRVIDVFPPHQQNQVRSQLSLTLQGVVCQTLVRKASGEGRVVATEVMVMTPAVGNVIREGKTYQVPSMLQAGREHGMHTLDQSLADLVNEGTITHEAALDRVQDPETFARLARRRQGVGA